MEKLLEILNECSSKENLHEWCVDENGLFAEACELFVKCSDEDVKKLLDTFKHQNHIWQHLFINMMALSTKRFDSYKPKDFIKEFILDLNLSNIACDNIEGFTKKDLLADISIIISPKSFESNSRRFIFAPENNSGKYFYCRFMYYTEKSCVQKYEKMIMEYCCGADGAGADDNMAFALCEFFIRSLSHHDQLHYYGDDDNYLISYKNRMFFVPEFLDGHSNSIPIPNNSDLKNTEKVSKYVKQLENGYILVGTTFDCAQEFLQDANEILTVITYKNDKANYFKNLLKTLELLIKQHCSSISTEEVHTLEKYVKLLDRLDEISDEESQLFNKHGRKAYEEACKKNRNEWKNILEILYEAPNSVK